MTKIVVDSTAYLDTDFLKKHDVRVAPIRILYKGRDFKEGEEISIEEFYDFLKTTEDLPKTSQPSVSDFINIYKPIIEEGHSVLSIHISEKVSGTINSARLAIETLKTNAVKIIDSRSTIYAIKYLVEYAIELIQQGLDFERIYDEINKATFRLKDKFALSEIKYLGASGRIKKEIALIGSVLNVIPVFSFANGSIKLENVFRSFNKAKDYLKNFLVKEHLDYGIEKVSVMYGLNSEEANAFGDQIERVINVKPDLIQVGCAIGNYAGPEWLGVGILRRR